ncbi:MAG TPA: glycosyltransferase [Dongiaceae bacterium]|nr:glycosyltransferase [Dongiaceae bacterium]
MLRVACLANEYPAVVEPYVVDQIKELQRCGVLVIAGSVVRGHDKAEKAIVVLRPVGVLVVLRAVWLCIWRYGKIADLLKRILFHGHEGPLRRVKALVHTVWGACYAVRLQGEQVDHIHVHHGFSASWIALVAARLLGVNFSMTLYGSDLLLHRAYLDVKLANCVFCATISEYNRRFILTQYQQIDPHKLVMVRLGVDIPTIVKSKNECDRDSDKPFRIVTVGRLHAVKDHEFLIRACAQLRDFGLNFQCEIAGQGPERCRLGALITDLKLTNQVTLLGFIAPEEIVALYERGDVVVLTSRSEGIPLVLMEAMARARLVLAPAITGIPELVVPGTGFLYEPGSLSSFVQQVLTIYSAHRDTTAASQVVRLKCNSSESEKATSPFPCSALGGDIPSLDWIRHAARVHVRHNFNREKNLQLFTELFLQRVVPAATQDEPNESAVLQQI